MTPHAVSERTRLTGRGELTELLVRLQDSDAGALDEMMPMVYTKLHGLARRSMRGERHDHTLQATALIHEAVLRLVGGRPVRIVDRAHFYALMARLMRRVLVDHARSACAARRGGGEARVPLQRVEVEVRCPVEELLLLDDALAELEELDPRRARVMELRFFGGMDVAATARVLGVSVPTVVIDTRVAKAWLSAWIGDRAPS